MHKVRRFPLFFPPLNRRWFRRQVRSTSNECEIDFIFSEAYFSETEPPLDLPLFYDLSDDHEAFPELYGSPAYKLAFRFSPLIRRSSINPSKQGRFLCFGRAPGLRQGVPRRRSIFKITNGVEEWALSIALLARKETFPRLRDELRKWSQVMPLIQVVRDLRGAIPDISLTLVGDGPEIPAAKHFVEENKSGRSRRHSKVGSATDAS